MAAVTTWHDLARRGTTARRARRHKLARVALLGTSWRNVARAGTTADRVFDSCTAHHSSLRRARTCVNPPLGGPSKIGTPTLLTRPSPSTGRPLAYAKFSGRVVSFGAAGPDATKAFERALAEWLANGRKFAEVDADDTAVADVIAAFLEHAEPIYSHDAFENLKRAVAPVLREFGHLPAAKFRVSCLEKLQNDLANVERQRTRKKGKKSKAPKEDEGKPIDPPPTYYLTRATGSHGVWSLLARRLPYPRDPLRGARVVGFARRVRCNRRQRDSLCQPNVPVACCRSSSPFRHCASACRRSSGNRRPWKPASCTAQYLMPRAAAR